ncbi:MAG: PQQ-binding-like beta-propeller repeat protein [Planctomycetota bacterium]
MRYRRIVYRPRLFCWLVVASLLSVGSAGAADGEWSQWGGPKRDFTCTSSDLAASWPADGPHQVWSVPLGTGHSSIIVDGDTIYTMCRRGDQDAVVALDAQTGATHWETKYDAPPTPGMQLDFGAGPHSTPLIVGDKLFTVGAMVHLHCLDKQTGKILWSHPLMDELGASNLRRGYGASPIAYQDLVIMNTGSGRGGDGPGLVAFKQETGEIVWKSKRYGAGYSSPILVSFNDEDHLVVALGGDRLGLDPKTGEVKWSCQVDSQSFGIMGTPLWIEPDTLLCSAGYGGGTRLFKLSVAEEGYQIEELWHYRKMQVVHGTLARIGDMVCGSHAGSFGPAFLIALDLTTGKPLWRKRDFAKANVLYADGKLIILDEQGYLGLATVTREGLKVHSKVQVLEDKAWTVPTLVGSRLYLRDNHTIKCLDLGRAANQPE